MLDGLGSGFERFAAWNASQALLVGVAIAVSIALSAKLSDDSRPG